jgi:hypothetical protein
MPCKRSWKNTRETRSRVKFIVLLRGGRVQVSFEALNMQALLDKQTGASGWESTITAAR